MPVQIPKPALPDTQQEKPPAVCFDLDGVLALTEPLKAKSHIKTVEHFGGKATFVDYLALMGKSHENVREGMIQRSGIEVNRAEYTQYFRQYYHELVNDELVIRPGAIALVRTLQKIGCRLAVVSSSTTAMVFQVLEKAGLQDSFLVVVSADDVNQKKPHPEPYLQAMERLGASPRQFIIFEDSPSGVEAGLKAGARVIAVHHDMNQDIEFDLADAELDGFDDPDHIVRLVFRLADSATQPGPCQDDVLLSRNS